MSFFGLSLDLESLFGPELGSNMASREEGQRQFDATFYENIRRFGMDFALREASIRQNAAHEHLQSTFNHGMQALGATQQMRSQNLQNRQAEMGVAEQQRRKRVSQKFMQGFNSMIRAPVEPGRMNSGASNVKT